MIELADVSQSECLIKAQNDSKNDLRALQAANMLCWPSAVSAVRTAEHVTYARQSSAGTGCS